MTFRRRSSRCLNRVIGVGLTAALVGACSSPLAVPDDATFAGEVVRAGHGLWSGNPDTPFQIHVKASPTEECGVILSVTPETVITRGDRTVHLSSAADVLRVGTSVAVWFGFVADSCPQQTVAQRVARLN